MVQSYLFLCNNPIRQQGAEAQISGLIFEAMGNSTTSIVL